MAVSDRSDAIRHAHEHALESASQSRGRYRLAEPNGKKINTVATRRRTRCETQCIPTPDVHRRACMALHPDQLLHHNETIQHQLLTADTDQASRPARQLSDRLSQRDS